MIDIVSKEDCVGCKACGDICPVNAIAYEIDDEGFWFPKINNEKCVHCEKCSSACPVICTPKRLELNDSEPKVLGYIIIIKMSDIIVLPAECIMLLEN